METEARETKFMFKDKIKACHDHKIKNKTNRIRLTSKIFTCQLLHQALFNLAFSHILRFFHLLTSMYASAKSK